MMKHLWNRVFRCANGLDSHPRACCANSRKKAHLKLEQLERRDCPAITMWQLNSTLMIFGDPGNNQIEIKDYGEGILKVKVTNNGSDEVRDYVGIRNLIIDTKGGADEVHYETKDPLEIQDYGELSLSNLFINLGSGSDVADLQLGSVVGELRSLITGGAGADELTTTFAEVTTGGDALSVMEGGLDTDVITCAQNNVAGSVTCISSGGRDNDNIICNKYNIMSGGRGVCISEGGAGNDTIMCTELLVAGETGCISNGGEGNDDISCSLTELTASGSALCLQTGGDGDDTMTCGKTDIAGTHVCFGDGGSGNDTMNWFVKGTNSGKFTCTMYGREGDDVMNVLLFDVNEETQQLEPVTFTGTVEYVADAGSGEDTWNAIVFFTPESDGVFQSIRVLLGTGTDTAILNFISLGATVALDDLYSGGPGEGDSFTYIGPLPDHFPALEDFEIVIVDILV